MNWFQELTSDQKLQTCLLEFLKNYGKSGLEQALQCYIDMQQNYMCKKENRIVKIKISSIYYLQIKKHLITIHTDHETYQKYGSLNNELALLSRYHFIKCHQNCLVALEKIKAIQDYDITLLNNDKIHMSRSCAPKVLAAFAKETH